MTAKEMENKLGWDWYDEEGNPIRAGIDPIVENDTNPTITLWPDGYGYAYSSHDGHPLVGQHAIITPDDWDPNDPEIQKYWQ